MLHVYAQVPEVTTEVIISFFENTRVYPERVVVFMRSTHVPLSCTGCKLPLASSMPRLSHFTKGLLFE